ncbi:hypothetical protein [Zooshikella harenae]|uniref:Zinc ribbon domain-containing protein n=1 Tax=Zooshikella harenae TaxID=2827238 RepID=A0ABS5ZF41_9GAMM|nr:hypothetical protein [Zooshikella harenae]MBU2712619.1 hypothetical protein [Zooshikella harenae]
MAITRYCWRCNTDVPMLDESEWAVIHPILIEDKKFITQKRKEYGMTIREVFEAFTTPSCIKYYELTGFKETNPDSIWHHRNSALGEDCPSCGKPFRTVKAKLCAACGYEKLKHHEDIK